MDVLRWIWLAPVLAAALVAGGCGPAGAAGPPPDVAGRRVRVVATTGMVADLVRQVGGERVEVTALMGPGVDPHLYKASEGDVVRMSRADLVIYNGLHLEGRMADVFEKMPRMGMRTVAVADGVPPARLLRSAAFGGQYDPHLWFDVGLWAATLDHVAAALAAVDPAHASVFRAGADRYRRDLAALDAYVRRQAATVPPRRRVLVTSHDAFGYFGRAYGFDVRGLQGISTVAEAGAADVQALAALVAGRGIPALFVESSVAPRGIEAVRAAVRARGADVGIGGHLYSDAPGDAGSGADTYAGMIRHNIDTIAAALGAAPVATR